MKRWFREVFLGRLPTASRMMDSFVMRIERITAQAVNRGIHEAYSRSPSSAVTISQVYILLAYVSSYILYLSDSANRNLFAKREGLPSSCVCLLVRFRDMQLFFGAHLILFSFSCQFDLAFGVFLAPLAVEVGRWESHCAGVLLLAMVLRL